MILPHYNYFRYYDSETGRYITSDPIGLGGGLNAFGYAYQNPLTYIDPFGESVFELPFQRIPVSPVRPIVVIGGLGPAIGIYGAWWVGDWIGDRLYPPLSLPIAGGIDWIVEACTSESNVEEERCRKVKNNCIASCSVFGLPSKYGDGVSFRRCIRNCMERQGCYNF